MVQPLIFRGNVSFREVAVCFLNKTAFQVVLLDIFLWGGKGREGVDLAMEGVCSLVHTDDDCLGLRDESLGCFHRDDSNPLFYSYIYIYICVCVI